MKIAFTAPVGPRKFLRTRREELAALHFERIGAEQMGATIGAEIGGVDLRRPLDDATFAELERALPIAFWDDRSTQHYASSDYWPEARVMERVTVVGDRPY
jgi:alpha-ketoglutarate-dependent taurine dioxygenase